MGFFGVKKRHPYSSAQLSYGARAIIEKPNPREIYNTEASCPIMALLDIGYAAEVTWSGTDNRG
jgi:hypothetical protein